MKKVVFITTQATQNYGSVLQTFATQMLINSFFCTSECIDYIRGNQNPERSNAKSKPIKQLPRKIITSVSSRKRNGVFRGFMNKNIVLSKKYYSEKELEADIPEADIYCTGSDQVWNSDWNDGFEEPYYLKFVPEGKRRISLSSSIGREDFADWEKEKAYELLSKYQFISVRESSAVQILEDIGIHNAIHLVDPTLQLDREFWEDFAAPRFEKEDYVLIYQLKQNADFDKYAVAFAKRKKMKLLRICTRYDRLILPGKSVLLPSISEFVSLFRHASYVITDSFHGTAFSLNLNKEVISIYPHRFSSRINDILADTGMLNRHLESYQDLDIADDPADFTSVNTFLNGQRTKCRKYLSNALSIE